MLQSSVQRELVAAGDAAGRMHDDDVADVRALGIERLLHDQGTILLATGEHRALAVRGKCKREARLPGLRNRFGKAHPKIIPPAGA